MGRAVAILALSCAVAIQTLVAQETPPQAQAGPTQNWTERPVTPDVAQALLEDLLQGEKHVTINAVIADTSEKDVNLGTTCRSSSDGTVEGKINDYGDVSGKVSADGRTNCSEEHNYFYWMTVAYVSDTNAGFVITARCDVRWRWNHCALPVVGAKDAMVLAREKKGKYAIYISLRKGSLDKKGSVSKYEVVDLKHFERGSPQ